MTEEIFRTDAYVQSCEAAVIAVNDRGGIVLDRTVFYPAGGGQPGDRGRLETTDGRMVEIATTVYGQDRHEIVHVPSEGSPSLAAGDTVTATLDWDRRFGLMRMHTALHLLSTVLPYPVTGGQIEDDRGRLDFDIPDAGLDRDQITTSLNRLVEEDHAVTMRWITDDELAARPELVKTMAVKPPTGTGQVRLIEIADCDLQPCGGTHVRSTGEIGPLVVDKIEKKGAKNRRVRLIFG